MQQNWSKVRKSTTVGIPSQVKNPTTHDWISLHWLVQQYEALGKEAIICAENTVHNGSLYGDLTIIRQTSLARSLMLLSANPSQHSHPLGFVAMLRTRNTLARLPRLCHGKLFYSILGSAPRISCSEIQMTMRKQAFFVYYDGFTGVASQSFASLCK